MQRIVTCLAVMALTAVVMAQNLSVTSAYDGGGAPFVRTELVTLALTGAEPFRPVTLFVGVAMNGVPVPGITGSLAVIPASIAPFGPFDGLGIFGGGLPLMTDSAGALSLTLRIPADFGIVLPAALRIQALALRNPFTAPAGEAFALSTPADVVVDEPQTSPGLSNLSVHLLTEGTGSTLVIEGTGFVPESTVLPTVEFISAGTGAVAAAAQVSMIDLDPSAAVLPALQVDTPSLIGAATAPPLTNAGPLFVRVSLPVLYPVNPAQGVFTTPPVNFGDPLALVMQSAVQPQLTQAAPQGALAGQSCAFTIDGSGFLNGARVTVGGTEAASVTVLSATQLAVVAPPLTQAVHDIVVLNVDHVPSSPRSTVPAAPQSDWVVFNSVLSGLAVQSIAPPAVQEGAPAVVTVNGTCSTLGSWSALDPRLGLCALRVGSIINGTEAAGDATVTGVTIPAAGQFAISATLPALPPGLNPPGLTANGLSNAGRKHFQIVPAPCLNPSATPHQAFAAIPAAEPGNAILVQSAAPPVVTAITPNNCARISGGQSVTLSGTGFFTNSTGFPATQSVPDLLLQSGASSLALTNVTMVDATTLTGILPDASGFSGALPLAADLLVTNPDTQASSGSGDDFWLYPALSGSVPNTFALASSTVDTGTLVTPIVYTFTGDLTLPAAVLFNASGAAPLLIRCTGNVIVDGTLDLDAFALAGLSASAAAGGAAATAATLGVQDQFQGAFGQSAFDPLTAFFYSGGGIGGFHASPDAGGGGGAGMGVNGAAGLNGSFLGGPGGLSYGFAACPIPLLGSAVLSENFWPPGGSGGAAGGLGTPAPFDPLNPPPAANIGFNGAGGRGAGAVAIMADGVITVNGTLRARGEAGGAGALASGGSGGGGGGGSGGSILLQSIRGIVINSTAVIDASGGAGGSGGTPLSNDGGAGAGGLIRCALPQNSAQINLSLTIAPGAVIQPAASTTGY